MADVAVVDVETTGLDPVLHVVWEWAIIVGDDEHSGQVRLTPDQLGMAQPAALEVSGFLRRYRYRYGTAPGPTATAAEIARLTEGRTLVGAQPHFDASFLTALLQEQPWKHRLMCVESMAAAVLGFPEPRSLSDTATALGIELAGMERHTALADARLAKQVYEQVLAREPVGASS